MNPLLIRDITKTAIFIMPLFLGKSVNYKAIVDKDFVNAYIADLNKPELDDKLLIVYKRNRQIDFGEKLLTDYVYKKDNKTYKVFVIEEDDDYTEDVLKVMASEYSKLSEEAKDTILKFWNQGEGSDLWCVLYKKKPSKTFWKVGEDLSDLEGELYPPFKIHKEVFDIGQ